MTKCECCGKEIQGECWQFWGKTDNEQTPFKLNTFCNIDCHTRFLHKKEKMTKKEPLLNWFYKELKKYDSELLSIQQSKFIGYLTKVEEAIEEFERLISGYESYNEVMEKFKKVFGNVETKTWVKENDSN